MLEICGLQKSWLPQVYESYQPVGTLRAEVAQELGLPTHTVVAAGAGDNAAAALGCGVIGPGTMNVSLGTSGTVFLFCLPIRLYLVLEIKSIHSVMPTVSGI